MDVRLKDPAEGVRFGICLFVSILIYLVLTLSVIGLFYFLFFALLFWISHGVLTGHLRGSAVQINERQFPEVHAEVVRLCDRLTMPVPEVYMMESGGMLNAFSSRFGGRDFVVIYSEIFELALDDGREALAFVLAHELAHLKYRHPLAQRWVTPAMWVPFLGAAYSRACERSCDRTATWLCPTGVERGFLALAAGRRLSLLVDSGVFLGQMLKGGFWYRLSEALSTHPHLSKRLAASTQMRRDLPSAAPSAAAAPALFRTQ